MAAIYPQPHGKPTIVTLDHHDFADAETRKLTFEEVPPIPADAERWEDRYGKAPAQYTKYIVHQATINGIDHRWKMTPDDRTLLAYFVFRPDPVGKPKLGRDFVSPWLVYYLSPLYGGG